MTERKREAPRILAVEDEPGIVELCPTVLEGDGFEVDVALNGKAAQQLIMQDDDYDPCLVDCRMPEMTGTELFQWLEENHAQLADRVVFTAGSTMDEGLRDLAEQSRRPFLPKRFAPGELRTAMREALGR